jgi:alpha-tubulin suppressor-like RCC1 family protein
MTTYLRCTLGLLVTLAACGDDVMIDGGSGSSSDGSDTPTSSATSSGTITGDETGLDPTTSGADSSESSGEPPSASCGDAQLDPGELCDDGNDAEDDECTTLCLPPSCGDGLLQRALGESCDDGNADDFDECPSDCVAAECGDGVREGLEGCDHGTDNGNGTSSCTSSCTANVCGDGYIALGTETCDDGAANGDGVSACSPLCHPNRCGDGYRYGVIEQCDEGDENGLGMCSRTCTDWLLVAGVAHTCARAPEGNVRCWGYGTLGALGYGSTEHVGDDETPADVGDVNIGGDVVQMCAGFSHTCAVIEGGAVRCWGYDFNGQLGYHGGEEWIGDDETPADAGDLIIGAPVVDLSCGSNSTCALLDDGTVRCWGTGATGTPGYGQDPDDIIGDEVPPQSPAAVVDLGGPAVGIWSGQGHTCALLDNAEVRCWGDSNDGRLGYGYATGYIGDDETPASVGSIPIGEAVVEVTASNVNTCVRLDSGDVRCVGNGYYGGNANGSAQLLGDDESFEYVPDIMLGFRAAKLRSGRGVTCAFAAEGNARCWGIGHGYDLLGYVGDDETPIEAGDLPIDEPIVEVASGSFQTCVVTLDGGIRCWGQSPRGELGYGNTAEQELAAVAVDVPFE